MIWLYAGTITLTIKMFSSPIVLFGLGLLVALIAIKVIIRFIPGLGS